MNTFFRTDLLGAVALGMAGLTAQSRSPRVPAAPAEARQIEHGRYLATIGACNDCHSPKIDAAQTPDPRRPFSGRPQTTTRR